MSMPLQNSDMDIKDMKIGTRISTETVFHGPATVSLDLFLIVVHDLSRPFIRCITRIVPPDGLTITSRCKVELFFLREKSLVRAFASQTQGFGTFQFKCFSSS
jgi:hypothetical protein